MNPHQFRDLPQIPSLGEDHHYMSYGMPYRQASTLDDDEYGFHDRSNSGSMRTQAMERYLLDPSSPITPNLLHANLYPGIFGGGQPAEHYRPWPVPEVSRHESPGLSSVSGHSSYAAHTEAHSPHHYPSLTHRGADDSCYSTSPYHHGEQWRHESFSEFGRPANNSIALRDLEFVHAPELLIEEVDSPDVKMKVAQEDFEFGPEYNEAQSGSDEYKMSSDSPGSNSLRDAESVQPIDPSEGDSSDAEYTPRSTRRRRSSASNSSSTRQGQRRRSHHGRKNLLSPASSAVKVTKRAGKNSPSATASKANTDASFHGDAHRHFPCPLAMYGCASTFSSKNEWKRHVSTQHIKLGFWRCNLCATTIDPQDKQTVYHNDFNRKDLFTQHLRRMHAAPAGQPGQSTRNARDFPVTDDNITEHQTRCFQVLRQTPTQSTCLYCEETFAGEGSWEIRMEHIGKHLEKERKGGHTVGEVAGWNLDKELEAWLLNEGIIAQDKSGEWRIGDGNPRRDSATQ